MIAQAKEGKLSAVGESFARLVFPEALERYLADRKARVVLRSHRSEYDHAKPLVEYFSATPIARVSAEAVLAYIRQRKEKGISNVTINMEVGTMRRVLKRAKRGSIMADDIPHLPERRDIGRAMTHEQKTRLLRLRTMVAKFDHVLLCWFRNGQASSPSSDENRWQEKPKPLCHHTAAYRAPGAEARSISAQSGGLESKKTSGHGEVFFLDFPLYRTYQS